jgi:hypothetical protein
LRVNLGKTTLRTTLFAAQVTLICLKRSSGSRKWRQSGGRVQESRAWAAFGEPLQGCAVGAAVRGADGGNGAL